MLIPMADPNKIIQLKNEHARALAQFPLNDQQLAEKESKEQSQIEFLAVLAQLRSPTAACRRTGVSNSTYYLWRQTDWQFMEALNELISRMYDELHISAVSRATGYFKADPETKSGYVEDADGYPIRFGASDALAAVAFKRVLGVDEKSNAPPVSIHLNFAGMAAMAMPPISVDTTIVHRLPGDDETEGGNEG